MVKHNNIVPNVHLHKDWKLRVKTWFDQPGRKQTRRRKRAEKAAAIFPRPLQKLKPIVQCPTVRYNAKSRLGRGFTLAELKAAALSPVYARSVGISVDHRRVNRSEENFARNVARLNEYKNKLVLFPRNASKPKATDASAEELEKATQQRGVLMPIKAPRARAEKRAITAEEKKKSAFQTLRVARSQRRLAGYRKKKAEEEANK
eukprot:CAMPEP_0206196134 /NCGR_PEP_ID=MMETSP0166-20121206/8263_1 /ASSEMBLY_ACC=CAM_ASM_000260 /TAXON_ID=95228 /ORGANISM="Vannella robusta, Strain DIVA3 518/3/11/1/6" /LENGTH=203 /DNA_ID=CAMNT_0053613543 /DNA_START=29 /DNA_END=640 /DNA_ORIENTATION=-